MTGIQWLEIYEPARAALMRLTAQADRQAEAAEAARQSDLESCAFEPCRIPPECRTPVRPGSHNAMAAFAAGCEDEWIELMKARYGGEW